MRRTILHLGFALAGTLGVFACATAPATRPDVPLPVTAEVKTGKDRVPHTRPAAGRTVEMTLYELGNFDFDPYKDTDVPADVKLLDGARVRLSGYMVPLTQDEKIASFALIPKYPNDWHGMFGPERTVICTLSANNAVDYTMDELVVEGILHIRISRDQDYTNSIFEMDVASVRPSTPPQTRNGQR